jgi:hypothetical protein
MNEYSSSNHLNRETEDIFGLNENNSIGKYIKVPLTSPLGSSISLLLYYIYPIRSRWERRRANLRYSYSSHGAGIVKENSRMKRVSLSGKETWKRADEISIATTSKVETF